MVGCLREGTGGSSLAISIDMEGAQLGSARVEGLELKPSAKR